MKIELREVAIREVALNYKNKNEEGVTGYNNKLNIRPKYQREFVYKDKQREAVINTIRKNFPLNVMYWVKNNDGSYEVLDGQQRTISLCEYVSNSYALNAMYFNNLTNEEQEQILDYKIMVYFCEGNEKEKLDWFKTINIAGEKLTPQELRNAIYTGEWLTEAKKYFSKPACPAQNIGNDFMTGAPIRQEYLETVLGWLSNNNIEQYMAEHQHKPNASELWLYFTSLINWVKTVFPNYRKEMKGIQYGALYNVYKDKPFDAKTLEKEVADLMKNEDVTKKSGIYEYVLTRNEKHLSIRAFTDKQKREAYERQQGICVKCNVKYEIDEMEADHIDPFHSGGKTIAENCQMLCKHHNRIKSGI